MNTHMIIVSLLLVLNVIEVNASRLYTWRTSSTCSGTPDESTDTPGSVIGYSCDPSKTAGSTSGVCTQSNGYTSLEIKHWDQRS